MRMWKLALGGVALGSLFAATAMADGPADTSMGLPTTVRRTAFEYDDYLSFAGAPADTKTATGAPLTTNQAPPAPVATDKAKDAKADEGKKDEEKKDEEKKDDAGDEKKDESNKISIWQPPCLKCHGFTLSGWFDQGLNFNNHGTDFNGVLPMDDRSGYELNQLDFYAEKVTDTSKCDEDWGARTEINYGSDDRFIKAAKGFEADWNETGYNQLTLPQFYFDYAYKDWLIRAGRFYSPVGYEVVDPRGNFFYSHSYILVYGEPFTHLGAYVQRKFGTDKEWTVLAGIVEGNDIVFSDTAPGTLLGITYTQKDNKYSAAFNMTNTRGVAVNTDQTIYSAVGWYQATEKLKLVVEDNLGSQTVRAGDTTGAAAGAWYGVAGYGVYQLNKCWGAGMRFEWFRDNNGTRVADPYLPNPTSAGGFAGDFYEITAGLNWKPNDNWVIRPELRYDWYKGTAGVGGIQPFGNGGNIDQLVGAVDAVLTF